MSDKLISSNNYIFIASMLISIFLCYTLLGIENIALGIISIIFTYIIYSAKPRNGDYVYIVMWMIIILLGCYIGVFLKLSMFFYLFLFIVSSYYYLSYNKDLYSDRAVPYLVIYASLGTSITGLGYKSAIAYMIDTIVTLIVLGVVYKGKFNLGSFKTGLFSKSMYVNSKQVLCSSFVYSCLLFLALYLPDLLGFSRSYWAPMTFIMLLKPKEKDTIKNTIKRFFGSVLGSLVVLFIMFEVKIDNKIIDLIIVGICAFLFPTFLNFPYLLKTFGTTVFILLVLEISKYWNDLSYALPYTRILETFIGGSLAIIGSFLLKFLRKRVFVLFS